MEINNIEDVPVSQSPCPDGYNMIETSPGTFRVCAWSPNKKLFEEGCEAIAQYMRHEFRGITSTICPTHYEEQREEIKKLREVGIENYISEK